MAGRNFILIFLGIAVSLSLFQAIELSLGKGDEMSESAQDRKSLGGMTNRYDEIFRKYTRTYFGRMSWKWFKAQSIQESSLRPQAKSSAGAMGLMQLMPGTFQEIRREIGLPNAPFDPSANIHAGIRYNLKCHDVWTESRSFREVLELMFASYNAGPGNIIRAQKVSRSQGRCDGKRWDCIKLSLPQVTGRHSKETIQYVANVEYYYDLLR